MTIRAGFIGLGNQGKPIAAHLAPRGLATTVYDVAKAPVEALAAAGAKAASSPRQVGQAADVVGICVPEDEHVRAVVFGEDGLLAGMRKGGVILIHSTVLPDTIEAVHAAAAEQGVDVLDACVTGGAERTAARRLVYMIGGEAATIEKVRPYLEATTDVPWIHAGPLGCGAKLKLCNNLNTYILFASAMEAVRLAQASGLSVEVLEQVARANGQFTDMTLAFLQTKKLSNDVLGSPAYQQLMRNHTNIAEKDLAWALQLAKKSDVSLPVGALVSQLMAGVYGVRDTQKR
ncbi:MAG: NAD(P)-dependent oxidoreductase [Myxococcota bacterium]